MASPLQIRPAGDLDLLSLGAVARRLDPGEVPFRKATECRIHVSGGEFNVAANLADCFGLQTGIATRDGRLPHRRAGRRADPRDGREAVLQAVQPRRRARARTSPRSTATAGHGVRAAGGLLQPCERGGGPAQAGRLRLGGDLRRRRALVPHRRDLRGAVGDHVRSDHRGDAGGEGGRAPSSSFDLNYRAKLWTCPAGRAAGRQVLGRIVEHVDVLVGNEEDLQKGLGMPGPEVARVEARSRARSSSMIDQVVEEASRKIKVVATTLREVHPPTGTTGAPWPGSTATSYTAPTARLDVHRSGRRRRRVRARILLRPAHRRAAGRGRSSSDGPMAHC